MRLKISEEFINAVGIQALKDLGATNRLYFHDYLDVDLTTLTSANLARLLMLGQQHQVKGSRVVTRDVGAWLRIKSGVATTARTCRQMHAMLTKYFTDSVDTRTLFRVNDFDDTIVAYYAVNAAYHPPDQNTAEYVSLRLGFIEFDSPKTHTVIFSKDQCLNVSIEKMFAFKSLRPNSLELMEQYQASLAKFKTLVPQIGLQVVGTGVGESTHRDYWRSEMIHLVADGNPARMVIDILSESDQIKSNNGRSVTAINTHEWDKNNVDGEAEVIEVPIHPRLVCFDLRRHTHFFVHVDNIEPYVYDTKLVEKLVLPAEILDFVNVLVSTPTMYQDIIAGKSGGSVILCCGTSGTGKTLTAEVYAETIQRPLYTVQCSQLGTEPVALEKALNIVLQRTNRWNAICLLDEADVYIATRENNLIQNSIVGVFLRVLERHDGTLFMTTNRGDMVDDAIASRCIARIEYTIPTMAEQAKLWSIISTTAGCPLTDEMIATIMLKHQKLTGRDIKNLIKLSMAVSQARGTPITPEMITFVQRFKPPRD